MKPRSVDLTNCDREPIQIPGSIQPHGCLLACDTYAATVLRHSANANAMLGVSGDINGKKLEDVLGSDVAHDVRNALSRSNGGSRASLLLGTRLASGRIFDITAHRFRSNAIIELEPTDLAIQPPLEMTRALIGRITAIESIEKLARDAARLVRAMLNYDRVMIYQFAHDGSGKVISESKKADLESFLGQHFPASDIPQQARALYLKNTIRIISDANFQPIPIVPALDASGEPLDLSFASLRSVSPIHCEYLRNMGVAASMSISIIVDGALWGLIACHHYSPRTLSIPERAAIEMFGEFCSLHLNALKQKQRLEAATWARQSLDRFLRLSAQTGDIDELLRENLPEFARLVQCDGMGIWRLGKWTGFGITPPTNAIDSLARFSETVADGKIWASHALSAFFPEAEAYAAEASGVLIIPLSQRPRDYMYFFRREIVQTLDWAGNPEKSYEAGPLGDRLTPRKSFAIWKETVNCQSAPWTEEEREIAEAIRAALVEVVLHQNELLADERARSDVRQRMLNEELNHRVKNILAVIKSLVTRQGQDGQSLESYVTSLRGRIQALAYAHDQVVRGDGGGSLADLVNAELTPYRVPGSEIVVQGPTMWLDARAFSVMALVLHELSTNAAKYGALSRPGGTLSIRWKFDAGLICELNWEEHGGPSVQPPRKLGFGAILIDRSVPFDLGGTSDVQYESTGLRARFRIPARHVSPDQGIVPTRNAISQSAVFKPDISLKGTKALIVEDQMLIAMDLEHMLDNIGISEIATTNSVREALERLGTFNPDIAVLDINLGGETSEAIADELDRRKIPFLFATGYGEQSIIPARFSSKPIIRKPYDTGVVAAQLSQLLARV